MCYLLDRAREPAKRQQIQFVEVVRQINFFEQKRGGARYTPVSAWCAQDGCNLNVSKLDGAWLPHASALCESSFTQ